MKAGRAAILAGAALVVGTASVEAQPRFSELILERENGTTAVTPLHTERGFAAIDIGALRELGWRVESDAPGARAVGPEGRALALRVGTPFFRWDGRPLQLADPVYADGASVFVSVQLLTDFLPRWFPELYTFRPEEFALKAAGSGSREADDEAPIPDLEAPSPYEGVRVVVIDAGHGGEDPGTVGPGGTREKDVALAIALRLAEGLEGDPRLEVHLIRDDDTFVPVWERGQRATDLKGERPGVLVSIHANSFPRRRSARGFETYFLSEARTEHERRVAALENAPLEREDGSLEPGDDLGFILRELRNLDQQHWSALLAEYIQDEVATVHPGPNRGVKQAPLAVMTNALMPAVLVEIGYLSNSQEARVLARSSFQSDAAAAVARAVVRFFERYPPEGGLGQGGAER